MSHGLPDATGRRGCGLLATVALGAVLLVVLALAAGWWWRGRASPTPWDTVRIKKGTVTVQYTGSECEDSARLEVEEDQTEVVLTVYAGSHAFSCSDVGVTRELTTSLDSPLGDRAVVDGACRLAEFASYLACTGK